MSVNMNALISVLIGVLVAVILMVCAVMLIFRWKSKGKRMVSDNVNRGWVNNVDEEVEREVEAPEVKETSLTGGGEGSLPFVPKDIPSNFMQVATLTNEIVESVPMSKFVWNEKTDGLRSVILIEKNHAFDITRNGVVKYVSPIQGSHAVKRSILDTELYDGVYIVFDALFIEGRDVMSSFYVERMTEAGNFLRVLKSSLFTLNTFKVLTSWNELLTCIQHYRSPTTNRIIDGVICTRIDEKYTLATNVYISFKLKVPCLNTVDFYIKYVPSERQYYLYLRGTDYLYKTGCKRVIRRNKYMLEHTGCNPAQILPKDMYVLFASPFYNNMSVMRPRPNWNIDGYLDQYIARVNSIMNEMINNPLAFDGKIVEMSYANDGWVPMRLRDDKQYSNSYNVGFSTTATLFDPINVSRNKYFAHSSKLSMNQRLIQTYHECSHVLRQYVYETMFSEHKAKILEDNKAWYNNQKLLHAMSGGMIDENDDDMLPPDVDEELNVPTTFREEIDLSTRVNRNPSNLMVESLITSSWEPVSFEFLGREVSKRSLKESKDESLTTGGTNEFPVYLSKPYEFIAYLDIAGGRGADIYTLCNMGVTNLFAVDADTTALVQYAKKRMSPPLHAAKYYPLVQPFQRACHDDMLLNVIHYELSNNDSPLEKAIRQRYEFPNSGFDIVGMNYAIHYLCSAHEKLKELLRMVNALINKQHGLFMITYFDGDKILSDMNGKNSLILGPFELKLIDSKDNSTYMYCDNDAVLCNMPLPSISNSGYMVEPLVTSKYLNDFDELFTIMEDYYVCERSKEFLSKIDDHSSVTPYLSYIKVRIYSPK